MAKCFVFNLLEWFTWNMILILHLKPWIFSPHIMLEHWVECMRIPCALAALPRSRDPVTVLLHLRGSMENEKIRVLVWYYYQALTCRRKKENCVDWTEKAQTGTKEWWKEWCSKKTFNSFQVNFPTIFKMTSWLLSHHNNMSYHIDITCVWAGCHIGRWRGWCWCYSWTRWLPSQRQRANKTLGHFPTLLVATEPGKPKNDLFLIRTTFWLLCALIRLHCQLSAVTKSNWKF